MPVAFDRIAGASEGFLCHSFKREQIRRRLVGAVGFTKNRQCSQRPLRPVEPPIHLGCVEQNITIIRSDCQRTMEVSQCIQGLPACQRYLPMQMPCRGRSRRSFDGLVG